MQKFDQKLQPLALPMGQSHHATLQRGTVIHVMTGQIAVITRLWLDNSLQTFRMPVHAGGVYCVATSGDYEIMAVKQAQVLQHRPPSLFGPLSWPGFLKKSSPDRTRGVLPGLLNNAAQA
jgi:hypothetical protein